jgi:hypothetical protein
LARVCPAARCVNPVGPDPVDHRMPCRSGPCGRTGPDRPFRLARQLGGAVTAPSRSRRERRSRRLSAARDRSQDVPCGRLSGDRLAMAEVPTITPRGSGSFDDRITPSRSHPESVTVRSQLPARMTASSGRARNVFLRGIESCVKRPLLPPQAHVRRSSVWRECSTRLPSSARSDLHDPPREGQVA